MASHARGHNFPNRNDLLKPVSERFLRLRFSDWMGRLQRNRNIQDPCLCCSVYLTMSGLLPFCLCVRFWLNSPLRNLSSSSSRKGKIACWRILLCDPNLDIYFWIFFACYISGLYSSRTTSGSPCQGVICLHVRAVLSPARPLCLLTASHCHSAKWTPMMWLAASFCICFLISASFIRAVWLEPFLIVRL